MSVIMFDCGEMLMDEETELKLMICCRVAEHQEINQMSASNLGIVFGPTLLRRR